MKQKAPEHNHDKGEKITPHYCHLVHSSSQLQRG